MVKLICIDLDGVLVPAANFWLELHKSYGTLDEGVELTKQYLHTDYERLIQEVVGKLWIERDASVYYDLAHTIPYIKGIESFFLELDRFKDQHGERIQRAIISGGCYEVAQRIAEQFGVDFIFANQLVAKEGRLTGEFRWSVGAGAGRKRDIIEQLCDDFDILPQDVIMIGDSESDLEAFRIAGISIAFNSKSKVLKEAATYVVNSADLHDVVPVLQKIRDTADIGGADSVKL